MCVEALEHALSETFGFYLKAHVAHWNVQGSNFPQYHQLFGQIYEDAFGAVDDIAERIRTLDELVDLQVSPVSMPGDTMAMLQTLTVANQGVSLALNVAMKECEAAGKYGIANFLQERLDRHAKWAWMLEATAKGDDPFVSRRRNIIYDRSRMGH